MYLNRWSDGLYLFEATRTANKLSSAVRADMRHGGGAARTERALIGADERFPVRLEGGVTAFADRSHFECHWTSEGWREDERGLTDCSKLRPAGAPGKIERFHSGYRRM